MSPMKRNILQPKISKWFVSYYSASKHHGKKKSISATFQTMAL